MFIPTEETNTTLLLENTTIFPDSTIIDNIRQTYINLHSDSIKIEAVEYFFDDCQPFLKDNLPFKTSKELFSIFSFYFSDPEHWGSLMQDKLKFFQAILEQAKSSANYLIITISLLSEFTHCRLDLDLPDYYPLINDTINEIIPQIKNNVDNDLTVFGHIIPPQFKNSFIINLLLSSKLTEDLVSDFFPYIYSHDLFSKEPKISLLFRDISNLKLIKIQPQTDASYNELSEFISNKYIKFVLKMNKEAISLLEYSTLFILMEGRCETNSLTEENILPFVAITLIFLQNYGRTVNFSVNFSNLAIDATKLFESKNLPYLKSCIDIIINNYVFICKRRLIPIEGYTKILEILLPHFLNGDYTGDRNIFYLSILDLTTHSRETEFSRYIKSFFNANQNPLFQYIFSHMSEIEQLDTSKLQKIYLKYFEPKLFIEYIQNLNTSEKVVELLSFIDKYCTDEPEVSQITEISTHLSQFLQEEVEAKRWDNVLLIGNFMKKNKFDDKLTTLKENDEVPLNVKEIYFGYTPREDEELDDLISHMIADPDLYNHDLAFKYLFDKLIKEDKDLSNTFFGFLMARYRIISSLKQEEPGKLLDFLFPIYMNHKYSFFEAASKAFYYDENSKLLINNPDFDVDKLTVSKLGLSIVSRLFEAIQDKPLNYQPYLILYNMAQSFPNLFSVNPQRIIDTVFPIFNYFPIVFESNTENDHTKDDILKTFSSAIHLFVCTFRSSIALNHCINWAFSTIDSFTDSQLASFLVALIYLPQNTATMYSLQIYIMKHRFIDRLENQIKRKISNEKIDKCIRNLIYDFIISEFAFLSKVNEYAIIQLNNLIEAVDNPFYFLHSFIFQGYPLDSINATFDLSNCSKQFIDFQTKITVIKYFYLSCDFNKIISLKADEREVAELVLNLPKVECVSTDDLPKLDGLLTTKMIRYVVMKPLFVYNEILYKKHWVISKKDEHQLIETVEHMKEMQKNYSNENHDEDDIDIKLFKLDDYLLKFFDLPKLMNTVSKEILLYQIKDRHLSNILCIYDITSRFCKILYSSLSYCLKELINEALSIAQIEKLYNIINFIAELQKKKSFKKTIFINSCLDDLLDLSYLPNCRHNSTLIMKVANILLAFKTKLPNRATQLIGFLFLFKKQDFDLIALKLIPLFETKQLENVHDLIITKFESEMKKSKELTKQANDIIKYYPQVSRSNPDIFYGHLDYYLDKYTKSKKINDPCLESLKLIIDILAPAKEKSTSISVVIKKSKSMIPQILIDKSPKFWTIYGKYHPLVMKRIRKDTFILKYFKFLLDYPDLLSFNIRSNYFKKYMKSKIIDKEDDKLKININSDDLLRTAFEAFKNKTPKELMKKFDVKFENEGKVTVDEGGPTRSFFTKVAKEIFNSKYGYFSCSDRSKSYFPSVESSNKEDYLDFFKFAGQFIARALIEGICIEAHMAISFCKQILERKINFTDLKDSDFELFSRLTEHILKNDDIESMDTYFEIDDSTGSFSLLDNGQDGSNVKVTNENKNNYVNLYANFILQRKIEKQIVAFVKGFESLISHKEICIFTAGELDMLICGVPEIDVEDFIKNFVVDLPYTKDSTVVKMFFNVIRKWDNELLVKLLFFMTGSNRVPLNGFKEFCQMSGGHPLAIHYCEPGKLPMAHTCFNILDLPPYDNEEDLNNNLIFAIENTDTTELL